MSISNNLLIMERSRLLDAIELLKMHETITDKNEGEPRAIIFRVLEILNGILNGEELCRIEKRQGAPGKKDNYYLDKISSTIDELHEEYSSILDEGMASIEDPIILERLVRLSIAKDVIFSITMDVQNNGGFI